jgi:hypothetical protein
MSDPIKGESKKQYNESIQEYFGHVRGHENLGPSADDRTAMANHLPSKEAEYKLSEYKTLGFNKSSRSGAFSKPSTGHAIFPNGLKFASDFIDEHTPGKYKPAPKPFTENLPMQQKRDVQGVPKPAFMELNTCIDCFEPINLEGNKAICDHRALDCECFTPNLGFIFETDQLKLFAMGLQTGDPIVTNFHTKCFNEQNGFKHQTMPVVRGGAMIPDRERAALIRRDKTAPLHDGQETTMGRIKAYERLDRLAKNTMNYIIECRKSGKIDKFREDRR